MIRMFNIGSEKHYTSYLLVSDVLLVFMKKIILASACL